MHNFLGFSLYLSTSPAQCPALGGRTGAGAPIFLSLHISEEFGPDFCQQAEVLCHTLADRGFRVIADVSTKTLIRFGCDDLTELAKRLRLWALRIDYGFRAEEIGAMASKMPIVLNASTTTPEEAEQIAGEGRQVFAMHNFYPRPETGLDAEYLLRTTRDLQNAGVKVLAFIPGDSDRRGPLFEGLPTLEEHRNVLPSAAFADMVLRFGMDGVFVGDPGIRETEVMRIGRFCRENILSIPADLDPEYHHLYGVVFTCRVDSPKWLVRFKESREYSCPGQTVTAGNCAERSRGVITIDNEHYGRYSGELQMIRSDLKADSRVNVIGRVPENAHLLMDCIRGGQRFMLVQP